MGCSSSDDAGSQKPDAGATIDAALPDGGPPAVRLTVLDGAIPTNATWVAYQDGDGPWTVIQGEDGEYVFPNEKDRYAIALVCIETDLTPVVVWRATRAELPALRLPCNPPGGERVSVSGQVLGVASGDEYAVSAGHGTTIGWEYPDDTYGVGTDPGPTDVMLRRINGTAVDFVLVRDLDLTADISLDLDLASGFDPIPSTVTVTGAAGDDTVLVNAAFLTPNGTQLSEFGKPSPVWSGIPSDQLRPHDLQIVTAEASNYPNYPVRYRVARAYLHEAADRTFAVPPRLNTPTVERIDEEPEDGWLRYARLRVTIDREDGVQLYSLHIGDPENQSRDWTDFATAGWLDQSSDVMETPDLSHLDGWNHDPYNGWGIEPVENSVGWSFTGYRSNRTVADVVDALGLVKGMVMTGAEEGLELTAATTR